MPEEKHHKKEGKKEETINFKLPKIKNGWALSTIILSLIIIAGGILFLVFYGTGSAPISGTAVSPNQVGQNLVSFLNTHTNSTIQLANVSEMSGIYQVDVIYQGQTVPVYATTDGKYLLQSVIPIQ